MKAFADYNPVVSGIYFLAVTLISMFCLNPLLLMLSLTGSLALYFIRNQTRNLHTHLYFLLLFIMMALINPLFYHNGVTVLLVINDNPITLEAVLYGLAASAMIISVLYWFRSFSQIMTTDRLLYILSPLTPKLALLLTMTLRYIPLFGTQARKVNQAQKALGLYKEDNAIDSIKGGLRVFSVMLTWALENGIITANSMAARGYGLERRTSFSIYRWHLSDLLLLGLILLLLLLTALAVGSGILQFLYYPYLTALPDSAAAIIAYIAYGILAFLPTIIEAEEIIRWKYLQSKA